MKMRWDWHDQSRNWRKLSVFCASLAAEGRRLEGGDWESIERRLRVGGVL